MVRNHAFRNALVPVVTVVGLLFALLARRRRPHRDDVQLAGARLQAVRSTSTQRDYGAVQGIITIFALVVIFMSLLIDIVNALIDPRVRY